jgi:hypothetical protein
LHQPVIAEHRFALVSISGVGVRILVRDRLSNPDHRLQGSKILLQPVEKADEVNCSISTPAKKTEP